MLNTSGTGNAYLGSATNLEAVSLGGPDPSSAGAGFDAERQRNNRNGAIAYGIGSTASGIASFFGALAKQQTLRSQELSSEYQGTLYDEAARRAEEQAHWIIEAGNREIGRLGMRAAQDKAQQHVNAARRGVMARAGSSAEVRASMEIVRQIEARTISRNTLRRSQSARRSAVDARNAAAMSRVEAQNARRARKAIVPALGFISQTAAGASRVSLSYAN